MAHAHALAQSAAKTRTPALHAACGSEGCVTARTTAAPCLTENRNFSAPAFNLTEPEIRQRTCMALDRAAQDRHHEWRTPVLAKVGKVACDECANEALAKEVPRFDQNQAAFDTKRLVLAQVGTANPASLRVVSMLVGKDALHDVYLFATVMPMGIEIRFWRPSNHCGVAGSEFRQGHNRKPIHHSSEPGRLPRVDHNPLAVIG